MNLVPVAQPADLSLSAVVDALRADLQALKENNRQRNLETDRNLENERNLENVRNLESDRIRTMEILALQEGNTTLQKDNTSLGQRVEYLSGEVARLTSGSERLPSVLERLAMEIERPTDKCAGLMSDVRRMMSGIEGTTSGTGRPTNVLSERLLRRASYNKSGFNKSGPVYDMLCRAAKAQLNGK